MKYLQAAAMAALCSLGTAQAQESSAWRFSAYGTLGAVTADTEGGAAYRSSYRQSRGATSAVDLGVDSRAGAQVDYRLDDRFSAVGQVLASRRDGSERPRVEWLYGQANLGADAALRVGRLVLPVFLFSDTRNVGFVQHWLRAPAEVYMNYPSSSFDGAQLQWRPRLGGINFTVQGSVGESTSTLYTSGFVGDVRMKQLRSINVLAEDGPWTYRAGVTSTHAKITARSVGLIADITDRFAGVGVQYDDGTWLALGEYTIRRQGRGGTSDSNGFYLSGGRRFGTWLPYATYSQFDPKGTFYGGAPTGRTTALGVRWDAAPQLALKAQYESSVPSAGQAFGPGGVENRRDRIHAVGVSLDFVF